MYELGGEQAQEAPFAGDVAGSSSKSLDPDVVQVGRPDGRSARVPALVMLSSSGARGPESWPPRGASSLEPARADRGAFVGRGPEDARARTPARCGSTVSSRRRWPARSRGRRGTGSGCSASQSRRAWVSVTIGLGEPAGLVGQTRGRRRSRRRRSRIGCQSSDRGSLTSSMTRRRLALELVDPRVVEGSADRSRSRSTTGARPRSRSASAPTWAPLSNPCTRRQTPDR